MLFVGNFQFSQFAGFKYEQAWLQLPVVVIVAVSCVIIALLLALIPTVVILTNSATAPVCRWGRSKCKYSAREKSVTLSRSRRKRAWQKSSMFYVGWQIRFLYRFPQVRAGEDVREATLRWVARGGVALTTESIRGTTRDLSQLQKYHATLRKAIFASNNISDSYKTGRVIITRIDKSSILRSVTWFQNFLRHS